MINIKSLMMGLIAISFCMANVSGKVTDVSGVIPVYGAVVQLEKGNRQNNRGWTGSFTLFVEITAFKDYNS